MTRMVLVLVMVACALGWGVSRGQAAMSVEEQESIVGGQTVIICGRCTALEGTGMASFCGTDLAIPGARCTTRNPLCVGTLTGDQICFGSKGKSECRLPGCIRDRLYFCQQFPPE